MYTAVNIHMYAHEHLLESSVLQHVALCHDISKDGCVSFPASCLGIRGGFRRSGHRLLVANVRKSQEILVQVLPEVKLPKHFSPLSASQNALQNYAVHLPHMQKEVEPQIKCAHA